MGFLGTDSSVLASLQAPVSLWQCTRSLQSRKSGKLYSQIFCLAFLLVII